VILATQDTEESAIAPIGVPRVANQPVGDLLVTPNAPAQDTNGMTAQLLAVLVLVDAVLVQNEILVNGEGTLHRSIGHDLLLDLAHIAAHRVGLGAEVLVLGVVHSVAALAHVLALGRSTAMGAGRTGSIHVVLTGGNLVRTAALQQINI